FIDNIWVFFIFIAIVSYSKFKELDHQFWLSVAIISAFTSFSLKAPSIFLILILIIDYLVSKPHNFLRTFAKFLPIAIAGSFPYFLALTKTGNPVFPFMNEKFQSPLFNSTENFNNAL